jgi:hypothetical protein
LQKDCLLSMRVATSFQLISRFASKADLLSSCDVELQYPQSYVCCTGWPEQPGLWHRVPTILYETQVTVIPSLHSSLNTRMCADWKKSLGKVQWSSSQYSTYMYVCYDSSNFALHYITIQGFFRNIALKGYLIQR